MKKIREVPSFDVGVEEQDIINEIVERVMKMCARPDMPIYKKSDALMDLTACHANGNPLRLRELLKANDGDFAHDIFGIRRHLNRTTGELEDCFSPRYSRPGGR